MTLVSSTPNVTQIHRSKSIQLELKINVRSIGALSTWLRSMALEGVYCFFFFFLPHKRGVQSIWICNKKKRKKQMKSKIDSSYTWVKFTHMSTLFCVYQRVFDRELALHLFALQKEIFFLLYTKLQLLSTSMVGKKKYSNDRYSICDIRI